jgi:hypothetical protein
VFYRIYDKLLESCGEVDCIRWEVEFSNERAHEVGRNLSALVEDPTAAERFISSQIAGNIDFRIRGNETHVDRRPRLSWWSMLVARLGEARTVVSRLKNSLQASAAWIKKSVAPTLAKLHFASQQQGRDFFLSMRQMISDELSSLNPDAIDRRDLATLDLAQAFGTGRAAAGWGRGSSVRPASVTARGGAESLEMMRIEGEERERLNLSDLLETLFGGVVAPG